MGLQAAPPLGTMFLPRETFAGQTVIVTGGGTGLGKAIAVEFARAGANVGILSRKPEHLEKGVAAVEAVGGRAVAAGFDDLGERLEADPGARESRQRPTVQPELQVLGHVGRVQHRHAPGLHGQVALVRHR